MDDRDDEFMDPLIEETGSDDLLADDNLRLPESASILVRVHAIRAWLRRRQKDSGLEIGQIALTMQEREQQEGQEPRMRRREREEQAARVQQMGKDMQDAQEGLQAYEEAEALLEDCINHTTVSDRLLVEYYLMLDDLIQSSMQGDEAVDTKTPRMHALADVLHRIEHVGAPNEED